ncbi:MAG TPA: CHAT domain-containing protein, partial [Candidatus Eisenbacteria bacterium]
ARALHAVPPAVVRARALPRALHEGAVVLDYLLHDGALHVIAVRRERLSSPGRLVSSTRLSRLAHALLFDLRGAAFDRSAAREATASFRDALAEVAAAVLWPPLAGAPLPRTLAIVPVGPLAHLPWAALPLPDGRPLCEALDLTLVPGLRLGLARPRRNGPGGRAAGPPLVVASDPGELESIEPETRAVLQAFPEARLVTGAEATAGRLIELAPSAPWVHFAGHGLYRADRPEGSGLRLADRWLLADEVAGLSLRARWVALSACQTARALVRPGEEWFGLARTFLLAGARSVLASQWDIADEAAARLMAGVYAHLSGGDPPARALGKAQAASAREGIHPLDWSGFVVLGGPPVGPGPDSP